MPQCSMPRALCRRVIMPHFFLATVLIKIKMKDTYEKFWTELNVEMHLIRPTSCLIW